MVFTFTGCEGLTEKQGVIYGSSYLCYNTLGGETMTNERKNEDNLVIHSLNPRELIDWCNARCREKRISRAKLAEVTGVPESTLDRILTGKNPEFRYSTIQPIIAYLIEFRKETPQPDEKDETQVEYYFNTIEGYKLIVENKNHEIEQYAKEYQRMENAVAHLKAESDRKSQMIEKLQAHILWMEQMIDGGRTKQ